MSQMRCPEEKLWMEHVLQLSSDVKEFAWTSYEDLLVKEILSTFQSTKLHGRKYIKYK